MVFPVFQLNTLRNPFHIDVTLTKMIQIVSITYTRDIFVMFFYCVRYLLPEPKLPNRSFISLHLKSILITMYSSYQELSI